MLRYICTFLALGIFSLQGIGQTSINVYLMDEKTGEAIIGAHVYFNNTQISTISDEKGSVNLIPNKALRENLIISHLSYEDLLLNKLTYDYLKKGDTLFMSAKDNLLIQVVISEDRSRIWKKRYKKFQAAFLGEGKAAQKCMILNPEVLRFKQDKDGLQVSAIEPIAIENNYLGYLITFKLQAMRIDDDGSSSYRGFARFEDNEKKEATKSYSKNRSKAYDASLRNFLKTLVDPTEALDRYHYRSLKYENGNFTLLDDFQGKEILNFDESTNTFHLYFREFLAITDSKIRSIVESDMVALSTQENSKFGSNHSGGSNAKVKYANSMLFKIDTSLRFDVNGFILNKEAIKEYGAWATHKVAMTLPQDYLLKNPTEEVITDPTFGPYKWLNTLAFGEGPKQLEAFKQIEAQWSNEYIPALLDILRLNERTGLEAKLLSLLQVKWEKPTLKDFYSGLQFLWEEESNYNLQEYGKFKSSWYQQIDPAFGKYFNHLPDKFRINLDEVVWGGVSQDGIPPLRNPKMISVEKADYLEDDHLVFGIYINGIAKAYPKRILAWHEFFVDDFAGQEIAGVYCTLCGTVIPYQTDYKGVSYDLGTSGFLYRSNKLMYDQNTQSLWNTIEGEPVIGPLVGQGIKLKSYPVVTTTWREWKAMHPTTKVLSLATGHSRNYNEGEAYAKYFASDRLMFPVPAMDSRLKNKAEVLVVRDPACLDDPLAVDLALLKRKKLIQTEICEKEIVIVSDAHFSGRVYDSNGIRFKKMDGNELLDSDGNIWMLTEEALISATNIRLNRIPSHHIFWFAWFNMFPETRLVK